MPPSATTTLDFTRDTLIRLSYQLCGLLGEGKEPSPADTAMAADFMNLELMALQAEGVNLRSVERTTLTLIPGTTEYTLPSSTIDVAVGPNDEAGTIVPPSGSESLVTVMSRTEWLSLANKATDLNSRSTPSKVFIERQAQVRLVFWPPPDTYATSFRYGRVRLLGDMDTGAVTVDLGRRWLKFVAYATATCVARAKSLGVEVISTLTAEAERLKAICKADDNMRGKIQFRMTHSGRHW